MNIIVGVDPSIQKTGLCILSATGYHLHLIDTRPKRRADKLTDPGRLVYVAQEITRLVRERTDEYSVLLVIEGHAGQRGHAMTNIALHWMIRSALAQEVETETISVAPSRLKKFICGQGNAEKGTVGAAAVRHWGGILGPDAQEDIMDAVGLCQLGVYVRDGICCTSYQREAAGMCDPPSNDSESIRMAKALHAEGGEG